MPLSGMPSAVKTFAQVSSSRTQGPRRSPMCAVSEIMTSDPYRRHTIRTSSCNDTRRGSSSRKRRHNAIRICRRPPLPLVRPVVVHADNIEMPRTTTEFRKKPSAKHIPGLKDEALVEIFDGLVKISATGSGPQRDTSDRH